MHVLPSTSETPFPKHPSISSLCASVPGTRGGDGRASLSHRVAQGLGAWKIRSRGSVGAGSCQQARSPRREAERLGGWGGEWPLGRGRCPQTQTDSEEEGALLLGGESPAPHCCCCGHLGAGCPAPTPPSYHGVHPPCRPPEERTAPTGCRDRVLRPTEDTLFQHEETWCPRTTLIPLLLPTCSEWKRQQLRRCAHRTPPPPHYKNCPFSSPQALGSTWGRGDAGRWEGSSLCPC